MAETIVMPQLGESVVEGTIAQWLVQVGDKVDSGQPLVEVETDKANTEVPASASGYVAEILVAEGDTVEVGTEIIRLSEKPVDAAGASSKEAASRAKSEEQAQSAEPKQAQKPAASKQSEAATPRERGGSGKKPRRAVGGPEAAQVDNENLPWNRGGGVARPTESASVSGVAMAQPPAQGGAANKEARKPAAPARRASQGDEQPAGGAFGAPAGARYFKPPVVRAAPEDTVVRFSKRRGIIAEHMVYSKHVSPHVPCTAEVDMTAVMDLRKQNKKRMAEQGIPLTVFAFLLAATAQALREFPNVNAVVGSDEIIQRGRIHLGIAVETDGGLLVPVIRDADSLSVSGIASAVDELATKAREKRITVDDLSGGTFTVSNPGRRGNLFGAAVINQPQAGILRMGEIVRRPVVRSFDGEEAICIRSMMYLSLSYDHRIIDGVEGNGFLYRVRELLEEASFKL